MSSNYNTFVQLFNKLNQSNSNISIFNKIAKELKKTVGFSKLVKYEKYCLVNRFKVDGIYSSQFSIMFQSAKLLQDVALNGVCVNVNNKKSYNINSFHFNDQIIKMFHHAGEWFTIYFEFKNQLYKIDLEEKSYSQIIFKSNELYCCNWNICKSNVIYSHQTHNIIKQNINREEFKLIFDNNKFIPYFKETTLEIIQNKSTENKPAENKSTEIKSIENKPAENKPTENNTIENKPTENNTIEIKSIENNTIKNKPTENNMIQNKSTEIKLIENNTIQNKSTEIKSIENKSIENNTIQIKSIENKLIENKSIELNNFKIISNNIISKNLQNINNYISNCKLFNFKLTIITLYNKLNTNQLITFKFNTCLINTYKSYLINTSNEINNKYKINDKYKINYTLNKINNKYKINYTSNEINNKYKINDKYKINYTSNKINNKYKINYTSNEINNKSNFKNTYNLLNNNTFKLNRFIFDVYNVINTKFKINSFIFDSKINYYI